MQDITVRHQYLSARQVQVTHIAEVSVVVAGQECEVDAVPLAQRMQQQGLTCGLRAVRRVVNLGHVAVDHHVGETLPQGTQHCWALDPASRAGQVRV